MVAGSAIDDAAQINSANGLTGNRSVGSEILGWYVEAGYDLWTRLQPGTRFEFVPYVRYEECDTQREVPAGFTRNPANDQQVVTLGAALFPHPQIVIRSDLQKRSNAANTRVRSVDVLAFHEPEDYLPTHRWLGRLVGLGLSPRLRPGDEVDGITGATLSARALTDAVRRTLALHHVLHGSDP